MKLWCLSQCRFQWSLKCDLLIVVCNWSEMIENYYEMIREGLIMTAHGKYVFVLTIRWIFRVATWFMVHCLLNIFSSFLEMHYFMTCVGNIYVCPMNVLVHRWFGWCFNKIGIWHKIRHMKNMLWFPFVFITPALQFIEIWSPNLSSALQDFLHHPSVTHSDWRRRYTVDLVAARTTPAASDLWKRSCQRIWHPLKCREETVLHRFYNPKPPWNNSWFSLEGSPDTMVSLKSFRITFWVGETLILRVMLSGRWTVNQAATRQTRTMSWKKSIFSTNPYSDRCKLIMKLLLIIPEQFSIL